MTHHVMGDEGSSPTSLKQFGHFWGFGLLFDGARAVFVTFLLMLPSCVSQTARHFLSLFHYIIPSVCREGQTAQMARQMQ